MNKDRTNQIQSVNLRRDQRLETRKPPELWLAEASFLWGIEDIPGCIREARKYLNKKFWRHFAKCSPFNSFRISKSIPEISEFAT